MTKYVSQRSCSTKWIEPGLQIYTLLPCHQQGASVEQFRHRWPVLQAPDYLPFRQGDDGLHLIWRQVPGLFLQTRSVDHDAIELACSWSIRWVNHFIQRKRSWLIAHFDLLNWPTLRYIPRDRSRDNVNVCSHLLIRFPVRTR